MKEQFVFWVERYFYSPTFMDRIISIFLLPLSILYCGVVFFKYLLQKPQDFGINVISIGNLTVGGSGKTPLVIAIASYFHHKKVGIVLRGYGRASKGLVVVKDQTILCDVATSGDEAMIYAKKLQNAIVIVSEDRKEGIKKAKALGADFVLLDDGYSKHNIKKLDFLIDVATPNKFCLPSGAYREKVWYNKSVEILKEEKDFYRKTILYHPTKKMVLLSAIARPQRLEKYLPTEVVAKYYFEDHHFFSYEELLEIYQKEKPDSFLVTYKDLVKLEQFDFKFSLLDLEIELKEDVITKITTYLNVH